MMSYCPSSGCNHQPRSQSQKMSIGIVVGSISKPHAAPTREAEVSITRAEKEASIQEHNMMVGQNVKPVKASSTINMCKEDVQQGSGRISARSFATDVPTKDANRTGKQAPRSAISGFHDKQPTSVHFSANQTVLQPGTGNKIEAHGFVSAKEGKPDAIAKDLLQQQPNEMESRSKETLRMKLQEILGTVPSAKQKLGGPRIVEAGVIKMQEQTHEGHAHFKSRQNSDPIETDSENPDVTIRRPVTRSRARKRNPARLHPTNSNTNSLSRDKEKHQGFSIPYAVKSAPSRPCAVNFGRLMADKNDSSKKGSRTTQRDTLFHATDVNNVQLGMTGGNELPPEDELPFGDGKTSPPEHGRLSENLEPEAAMENNHSPEIRDKDQLGDPDSPAPPEKSDNGEFFCRQSPVHHGNCLDSPLFKMTKNVQNSPMSSMPPINEKKKPVHGFAQEDGEAILKAIFKSSLSTEQDDSGSSDHPALPEDAYATSPELFTEEKDAKKKLFPPKKRDSDSIGEVSSAKKGCPEYAHTSPDIRHMVKPMVFRAQRHHGHGVNYSESSPTLHSPEASGSSDDIFMEPAEESAEDGLERAVSLLGLALERVKNKMMLATNKRCTDILMSAAEEIHLQLQNVQSHIQTDVGKLTSLNKSKRKYLERKFQEQQEQLKAIHEKFKEEIIQYLKECKGAMEDLEAEHVELKGAIDRQKASQRKLLIQAEEAVETHISNAQRQITSAQKVSLEYPLCGFWNVHFERFS